VSTCIAISDRVIVYDELTKCEKSRSVFFDVLSWHSARGTEKQKLRKPRNQSSRFTVRDFNTGTPEYKAVR